MSSFSKYAVLTLIACSAVIGVIGVQPQSVQAAEIKCICTDDKGQSSPLTCTDQCSQATCGVTSLSPNKITCTPAPTADSTSNFNDSAYRNAAQSVFIPANCAGDQANNECSVCDIFQLLINVSRVILALTGVAAVLMLILAGFLFITAYGDTSRISQGKEIIKAVIVGVFVIMIAWTLVNTVIISLTNGAFNTSTLISGNLQCEAAPKKN